MKRSRFTEGQIIGVLKEHQAGLSAAELCRKHGISDATFYNWRSKYGGMEVSEAKRLKQLEDENAKLKRLLAESVMDVSTLREMLGKTSEAWGKEIRRVLGHDRERLFAASRLPSGGHRSASPSLPIQPPGRRRAAKSIARAVRRAAAVRLSPPAHPA
jgi:putative transposase